MTTNHTELCERLRTISSCPGWDEAREAAALIESQAARIQQQAARIAELDRKHKEAWDDCGELNATNHELLAACGEKDRRIAELEKERDALKADAERYEFLRRRAELREYSMGFYWHIKTVDAPMGMPLMDATLGNVINAALQAEKETQ